MQLGRVYDAACELMLERSAGIAEDVVIPLVGECDDSFLNDARRMQVSRDDVARGVGRPPTPRWARRSPPDEGAVGAGTGMAAWASRAASVRRPASLPSGHTVGVLLLRNFGERSPAHGRRRSGRSTAAARSRSGGADAARAPASASS